MAVRSIDYSGSPRSTTRGPLCPKAPCPHGIIFAIMRRSLLSRLVEFPASMSERSSCPTRCSLLSSSHMTRCPHPCNRPLKHFALNIGAHLRIAPAPCASLWRSAAHDDSLRSSAMPKNTNTSSQCIRSVSSTNMSRGRAGNDDQCVLLAPRPRPTVCRSVAMSEIMYGWFPFLFDEERCHLGSFTLFDEVDPHVLCSVTRRVPSEIAGGTSRPSSPWPVAPQHGVRGRMPPARPTALPRDVA